VFAELGRVFFSYCCLPGVIQVLGHRNHFQNDLICVCVGFHHEFSSLHEGNLEIVDEMGIVADEETTVEVAAADSDVLIKPEEMSGSMVTIVQFDDGLTQVGVSPVCT